MLMQTPALALGAGTFDAQANISARLERLPITRQVFWARNIIGAATFWDAQIFVGNVKAGIVGSRCYAASTCSSIFFAGPYLLA